MEEVYKPVPDVEALRYHGTPEKPDIKIFVSHRIDQDSETIDNPLYIPVRCGAVYDERENVQMLGDDTGDNISEKRMSFCEYTVMYWAWKNVKADYYGLCHYRRYLSFLDKDIPGASLKQGLLDSMSHATQIKCGLLDADNIRKKIERTDIIAPYEYTLSDAGVNHASIKESWIKDHYAFLQEKHFDLMLELIRKHSPEYYDSAVEYMNGKRFIGFNCFIMKREYFHKMCEFVFPILFEFDASIDKEHFSSTQKRAVGYLGEWLFSIFLYHCEQGKTVKVEHRQLLAFQNTNKACPIEHAFDDQSIPIVLPVTDGNRPILAVQIQSILTHISKENQYDLILLRRSYDEDKFGTYLRKQEDQSLRKMAVNYPNVSLRFYDPKDDIGDVEVQEWGNASREVLYYLLLLPWILQEYDKVIYLQDSMLIEADLRELYKMDLDNFYAAAPKSIYFSAMLNGYSKDFKQKCEKKLNLNNVYDYVSTDVVVMNLNAIRKDFTYNQIIETIHERKVENITGDGFNMLFEGKIRFLSQAWNKIDCCGPEYFRLLEYFPEEEFQKQSEQAKALNLKGIFGQWLPQQAPAMRQFWVYARNTEFYEQILLSFVPNWSWPIFDHRTGARKVADFFFPKGTKRREFLKKIIPKGSRRYAVLKQIYYVFNPKLKRPMHEDIK